MEISKELFEAVYNCDIATDKDMLGLYKRINIYEFAFKCKEWALTKGYFIYSANELSFIKTFLLETIETFSNGKDTEVECIIKACEWILKDIK